MEKDIKEMKKEGNWYFIGYRMVGGGIWSDSYDYEYYTFFNPVLNQEEVVTGYYTCQSSNLDKGFPRGNAEVMEAYYKYKVAEYIKIIKDKYDKYSKVAEGLNEEKRIQEKGQIVEVVGKGKHHGKVGRVSWIGKSKFGNYTSYNYGARGNAWMALIKYESNPFTYGKGDFNLARVFPTDGSAPFYVAIDACKVVEGFKPYECTMEWVKNFYKSNKDNGLKMHGTWNESGSKDAVANRALDEALRLVA